MVAAGFKAEDLADQLFDSLHQKLMKLPDETILYPGHGQGSLCGKKLCGSTVSTIGVQRESNQVLQIKDRAEFVKSITSNQAFAPKYFGMDAKINQQGAKHDIGELMEIVKPMELEEFKAAIESGEFNLLDSRDSFDFSDSFIPGFTNVCLDGKFATWSGILMDLSKPIIFVADDEEHEETIIRLARVGLDNIHGYLKGGMEAWEEKYDNTMSFKRYSAMKSLNLMLKDKFANVIDIRAEQELEAEGSIAGSEHFDLVNFMDEFETKFANKEEPILLFCKNGYRSATAISLLKNKGYGNIYDIRGGYESWKASGLPIDQDIEG